MCCSGSQGKRLLHAGSALRIVCLFCRLQLHMGRDAAIASMLLPGYMQQGEMHDLPTGVHELQTMVRELAASQAAAAAEAGRLAGLRAELAAEVTASRVAWHAEAAHRVALEAQLRGHGH